MRARAKTFYSEAWSWASLDEPRRASGSCSCQYVLLPRPVLGSLFKLIWLVLGGDPAAHSHRVEQFTAL